MFVCYYLTYHTIKNKNQDKPDSRLSHLIIEMALFQMKWLRSLVRRNTKPIEYRHALAWKDRLSLAYMLVAWNAFGLVCYMIFSGRADWAKHHGLKDDEEGRMSSGTYFLYIILKYLPV